MSWIGCTAQTYTDLLCLHYEVKAYALGGP